MCFPYEPERVAQAGAHFDQMVAGILAEDFAVHQPPEARVCREYNFRAYCVGKGATRQQGSISNHEYRQAFGVSNKTAYQDLQALVEWKMLQKVGQGKQTRYVLPSQEM